MSQYIWIWVNFKRATYHFYAEMHICVCILSIGLATAGLANQYKIASNHTNSLGCPRCIHVRYLKSLNDIWAMAIHSSNIYAVLVKFIFYSMYSPHASPWALYNPHPTRGTDYFHRETTNMYYFIYTCLFIVIYIISKLCIDIPKYFILLTIKISCVTHFHNSYLRYVMCQILQKI